jgi:hypothetical protein
MSLYFPTSGARTIAILVKQANKKAISPAQPGAIDI